MASAEKLGEVRRWIRREKADRVSVERVDGFDQLEFGEAPQLAEAGLLGCEVTVETRRVAHAFGPGNGSLWEGGHGQERLGERHGVLVVAGPNRRAIHWS